VTGRTSRVAVIGAGMTGLTAAHRLAVEGAAVDVYERWPGLGGMVATVDVGAPQPLERYYHHLFESDHHIAHLYEELGMGGAIEWHPSKVGLFADGAAFPFVSPLDLLRFRPLSLVARLRLGLGVLRLMRERDPAPFEHETAREWITRSMGEESWSRVWGPLLRGKFGDRADGVPMAWLWARITVRRRLGDRGSRRELLGYPRGGWQPLLERLRNEVESRGGRVLIDRPVAALDAGPGGLRVRTGASGSWRAGHDPRAFPSDGEAADYDAVVATVPCDIFAGLLGSGLRDDLAEGYLDRLEAIDYSAALCLLLEVDRSVTPYYWLNVAERGIPFIGLVEHTNLVGPESYGGKRFVYVANYVDRDDPLLELGVDELLDAYEPGLRRVNSEFSRSWVRRALLFREPAAAPVVAVGQRDRIPPMETGVPGLYLANTTQIYPEDRGTNYSVELGERVAAAVLARQAVPA
jgi:protoporphyrinogen oxidase